MMINATFNNIPVISWQSVLMVEETRIPREYNRPTDKLYHIMLSSTPRNERDQPYDHDHDRPSYIYMCVNLMLDKSY